ncbi:uncharacterized protein LOC116704065 [Etheostoma spectabile]|uniref:uncharacterized protein LOC116704065 n=1 Tax=Etheostoma spectabile TaxID=54343 RepID=UPI0013AFA384|nr:uncharacterized protein LOC116704065 [Etheostoma spectabile]
MGDKVFGQALLTEAARGDAIIDMGPDKSVLILIKHCQDMKRQETRLRIITLVLLLSCTALFIVAISADLWKHGNSGSSGQESAVEPPPAMSKQESVIPTANPRKTIQRLHIDLMSLAAPNNSDGQYLKWHVMFGEDYNKEKGAIVIPEDGFYFVYLSVTLSCSDEGDFNGFYAVLYNWNEHYDDNRDMMEARDRCTSEGKKSVFVAKLLHLLKGDHLRVRIIKGYKLIDKSSFGAYFA